MTNGTQGSPGRVSKREYISRIAKRAGVPVRTAAAVYAAAIEELVLVVSSGERLTLTGFGKFYPQEHKGHKVRFAAVSGGDHIGDYTVLKFSATRDVNRRIGAAE